RVTDVIFSGEALDLERGTSFNCRYIVVWRGCNARSRRKNLHCLVGSNVSTLFSWFSTSHPDTRFRVASFLKECSELVNVYNIRKSTCSRSVRLSFTILHRSWSRNILRTLGSTYCW